MNTDDEDGPTGSRDGHLESDDGMSRSGREVRGPTVDPETLGRCLETYPLRVAVVFGSVVDGSSHRFSDVDVGFVFESSVDREQRVRLLGKINAAVIEAIDWDDVDVVDLERSPPAIAYKALSTGTLLLGDDADATELEAKLLRRKLDFQPVQREWQDALDARLREGSYGRA